MAHIRGFYNGNIYYRYCFDANRHVVPLVMGYIVGNESESSHNLANRFTLQTVVSTQAIYRCFRSVSVQFDRLWLQGGKIGTFGLRARRWSVL